MHLCLIYNYYLFYKNYGEFKIEANELFVDFC